MPQIYLSDIKLARIRDKREKYNWYFGAEDAKSTLESSQFELKLIF